MIDTNGMHIIGTSVTDVWSTTFDRLMELSDGIIAENSRDGAVSAEVLNAVLVVEDPTRNILDTQVRKLNTRYAVGELLWYLSGNPALRAIQFFTHAWDRMSDDGYSVNSNYGQCIKSKFGFDQWKYVKELLSKDPNTRQAVIHIKEPRDTLENPTKDLNCTCTLQFFIRKGKLYLTTYMRSNDIWLGTPNDMFAFTCLQMKMAMEIGVELGTYTHVAGSLHLYERDYEKAHEILQQKENANDATKNDTTKTSD